jgi:hypothetical protein
MARGFFAGSLVCMVALPPRSASLESALALALGSRPKNLHACLQEREEKVGYNFASLSGRAYQRAG